MKTLQRRDDRREQGLVTKRLRQGESQGEIGEATGWIGPVAHLPAVQQRVMRHVTKDLFLYKPVLSLPVPCQQGNAAPKVPKVV